MKKVLMILLTLAMVFSMAGVVSADITGGEAGGSDDMEVSHDIAQSFVITIPVDVAFNDGLSSEQAVTASNVLIPSKYILNVTIESDNDFVLISGSGLTVSTIPYTVTKWDGTTVVEGINDVVLKVTEGVDSSSAKITFATTEADIKKAVLSGKHTDKLEFTVGIEVDPTATDVLKIGTADQLRTFAKFVNEGKTDASGKKYSEMNVELTADIDLENEEWTPIGTSSNNFEGIFDGQGYTISSMTVNGNAGVGLFGYVKGTIKNVIIDSATITGNHYLGGIVGYIYGSVTGCTVKDSTLTCEPELLASVYDNGDKAGGLIGYLGENGGYSVTDNTVSNTKISGYRDVGGLIGYANDNIITGNTVRDSIITLTPRQYESNYAENKPSSNAGKIVGRSVGKVDGNTAKMVIVWCNGVQATVTDGTELETALTEGKKGISLSAGTYKFPSSSKISEGVTLYCEDGTVFDGKSGLNINGATVVGATFNNPNGNAVSGTINGVLKDCTFTGSNGLRGCYAGDTVIFENCVFDGSTYGVHFDGGANAAYFKGCTFSGFNAFGSALTQLTLEDCTFKSSGKSSYNGINLWGDTDLSNCKFIFDGVASTAEWVDLCGDGKTVTFTDCVVSSDGISERAITTTDVGDYGEGNTLTINP